MKRYNIATGIFSESGRTVTYEKTEFFIRTADKDIKFSSKKLAYDTAIKINKAIKKVVAIPVTKLTFQKIDAKGNITFEDIKEIMTDKSVLEILMKS